MRRQSLSLLAALAFAAACTQGPAPAGTEAGLRAAIASYDSAWLAKDHPAVDRILSPKYTYFTSRGGLSDKAATLAFLADTGYTLTLSRRSDIRLALVGATAVMSSRWEGRGRYHAEAVNDDQTCGQTWVWDDDRWMLLAEHCLNRPATMQETT